MPKTTYFWSHTRFAVPSRCLAEHWSNISATCRLHSHPSVLEIVHKTLAPCHLCTDARDVLPLTWPSTFHLRRLSADLFRSTKSRRNLLCTLQPLADRHATVNDAHTLFIIYFKVDVWKYDFPRSVNNSFLKPLCVRTLYLCLPFHAVPGLAFLRITSISDPDQGFSHTITSLS